MHSTLAEAINSIIAAGKKVEKDFDTHNISDTHHTFGELYDHRVELFIQLCRALNKSRHDNIWRSKKHSDGELAFGGDWFVMGIYQAPGIQITYHIPIDRWDDCHFAFELGQAPPFDGHTSKDVLQRLKQL